MIESDVADWPVCGETRMDRHLSPALLGHRRRFQLRMLLLLRTHAHPGADTGQKCQLNSKKIPSRKTAEKVKLIRGTKFTDQTMN